MWSDEHTGLHKGQLAQLKQKDANISTRCVAEEEKTLILTGKYKKKYRFLQL